MSCGLHSLPLATDSQKKKKVKQNSYQPISEDGRIKADGQVCPSERHVAFNVQAWRHLRHSQKTLIVGINKNNNVKHGITTKKNMLISIYNCREPEARGTHTAECGQLERQTPWCGWNSRWTGWAGWVCVWGGRKLSPLHDNIITWQRELFTARCSLQSTNNTHLLQSTWKPACFRNVTCFWVKQDI